MYLFEYDKTGPENLQRFENIKEDDVIAVPKIREVKNAELSRR